MLTMPLYGLLYIGYAYSQSMHIASLWRLNFFISPFDLERSQSRSRSRSLGLVTSQIEATVAWNMMAKKKSFSG